MGECQQRVHKYKWKTDCRVDFDPAKEELKVIHPMFVDGPDLKLIGVMMDVKLTMSTQIDKIMKKARPKVTADLINQSKMF